MAGEGGGGEVADRWSGVNLDWTIAAVRLRNAVGLCNGGIW